MPALISDLLYQLGGDAEEEVAIAVNHWKPRVQEAIKDVTRLKLVEERYSSRRIPVPIQLASGYPASLNEVAAEELNDEKWAIELIGTFKSRIDVLDLCAKPFSELGDLLRRSEAFSDTGAEVLGMVDHVEVVCRILGESTAKATLRKQLTEIEDDILGAYFSKEVINLTIPSRVAKAEIYLYWMIIAVFSRLVNISIEQLTVLVMAHELAHAYSHVGSDASGSIWLPGFGSAATEVKEGIAQYYTWAVARHLDERNSTNFLAAYETKIKHQCGPYIIHVPWTKEYSLEVFRTALIEIRNRDEEITLEVFKSTLKSVQKRLGPREVKTEIH